MPNKYAKIKRHDLKNLVEKEYMLKVDSMYEYDRGILLYTDKGIKMLKRVKSDEAKILFTEAAYEHIMKKGFSSISCINKTYSHKCSINYNDYIYILQDFISGKVYDITTPEDAEKAAAALAKFHACGKGFVPCPGSRARVDWGKWIDKYKTYAANIKKYKEVVENKESQSKFDVVFLKYADIYYDRMYKAYQLLKNFEYLKKVEHSMRANQITHKEFKKHSIMISDQGELFICNMEECAYDIRETDIASFFESFSGKNKVELVDAALRAYSNICAIDRNSVKIVQAFLLCPDKFYKVVEKYYGNKKNITENELVHKLERSVKKESRKDEIISFLETYKF